MDHSDRSAPVPPADSPGSPRPIPWERVAQDPEFRRLLRAKNRFIIPATIFFVIYYFALPVLVGYFPELMARRVIGLVNWAYLFALSQFAMAWVLAVFYLVAAARFDRSAASIVDRLTGEGK